MKNKVVFIDMDGTICSYSTNKDKVIVPFGGFNNGFFTERKPVKPVINKIIELFGDCHLAILSASPHNRGIIEKNDWLDRHFNITDRNFVKWQSDSKAQYILDYCDVHNIKPSDCVLIDDVHSILEEVEAIGCQVYHVSRLLTLEKGEL